MNTKKYNGYWIAGLLLISQIIWIAPAYADSLSDYNMICDDCRVSTIYTELLNGDLAFKTVDGVGGQECVGEKITTTSSSTNRQRDQMLSVLMAAMLSGKRINVWSRNSGCEAAIVVELIP